MNALSLHQPWASAMALGLKTVETRSWAPPEACIGERFVIASTQQRPAPAPDGSGRTVRLAPPGPEWIMHRTEYPGIQKRLPLGCIVASGVLTDAVPIIDRCGTNMAAPAHVCASAGSLLAHAPESAPWPDGETEHVLTSDLPWGDFSPGRWAWLFSDLARVEDRCPWCWGTSAEADPYPDEYVPGNKREPCRVCAPTPEHRERGPNGAGTVAPISVRGRQRVWRWEP